MEAGNNSFFLLGEGLVADDNAYHLSLQIDRDVFQWAVIALEDSFVKMVGEIPMDSDLSPEPCVQALQNAGLASKAFHSVSLAFRGGKGSLVPSSLFNQQKSTAFLKLSASDIKGVINHQHVSGLEAVYVYTYDDTLERSLRSLFPHLRTSSSLALNLGSVMHRNRFDREMQVYADMSDSFVDVIVAGKKQLVLANSFELTADEDALYHLSNVIKTLSFEQDQVELFLSGDIELTGKRYDLFKNYYPKLKMNFGFEMPKVDIALSSLRKQRFMSLLNQYPCVS